LIEESCGRVRQGPGNDSPNPWFGCKNRVKRSLRVSIAFSGEVAAGSPSENASENNLACIPIEKPATTFSEYAAG
jgi:hypothetical protein